MEDYKFRNLVEINREKPWTGKQSERSGKINLLYKNPSQVKDICVALFTDLANGKFDSWNNPTLQWDYYEGRSQKTEFKGLETIKRNCNDAIKILNKGRRNTYLIRMGDKWDRTRYNSLLILPFNPNEFPQISVTCNTLTGHLLPIIEKAEIHNWMLTVYQKGSRIIYEDISGIGTFSGG